MKKKRKITEQYLYNYSMFYLSKYSATEYMVVRVLKNRIYKNLTESESFSDYSDLIKTVIDKLKKNKIIDDKRYTEMFFHSAKSEKLSSTKSINYLISKGIKKETIYEVSLKSEVKSDKDKAIDFAKSKKLGKYGTNNNLQKDLGKMSRAGFTYTDSINALV